MTDRGKKIRKGTAAALAAAALAACAAGCGKKAAGAEEWVLSKGKEFEKIEAYLEKVDGAVGSYSAGEIGYQEFSAEIGELRDGLGAMESEREAEGYPAPGTHTPDTVLAREGLDAMWEGTRKMTDALATDPTVGQDPAAAAYVALAFGDGITKGAEDFVAGFGACGGTFGDGTEGGGAP